MLITEAEARVIALDAIVRVIKQPYLPMRDWSDYPMLTEVSWWRVEWHIDQTGNELEGLRQKQATDHGIDLEQLLERAEGTHHHA